MPYVVLALFGWVMLRIVRSKADAPWVVAMILMTGGAIGLADLFLTALLNLYSFRTGLMPDPTDTYLGMLLSDKLFVPAYAAAIIPALVDRPVWAAGAAALPLGLVEFNFYRTGFFAYRGWHTIYTVAWFASFFAGAWAWLRHLQRAGYTPFHRALILVGATGYGFHLWGLIGQILLHLFELRLFWLTDAMKDRVVGGTLCFGVPYIIVATATIWKRRDQSLHSMAAAAAMFALWFTLLRRWGIWRDTTGWTPLLETAVIVLLITLTGQVDRWLAYAIPGKTVQSG